jgi:hypothetical protein
MLLAVLVSTFMLEWYRKPIQVSSIKFDAVLMIVYEVV